MKLGNIFKTKDKPAVKKKPVEKKAALAKPMSRANKFLIKHPLVTEKGTDLGQLGKYLFLVDKRANKPEVKKIVENVYKVKVTNVHIVNTKPKRRRLGRTQGQKSGYKKAIVTLASGQKLDILPQ